MKHVVPGATPVTNTVMLGALLCALGVAVGATGCRGDADASGASPATDALDGAAPTLAVAPLQARQAGGAPALSLAAQVGRFLFFDKSLSASGTASCATCHDPDHAYGPPNGLAVQPGGADGHQPGLRAVPSLRYKEFNPPYADLLDNPDGVSAPGPGGGFAWDGRASTLAEQAKLPLLAPFEMANATPADVVAKVRAAPYAPLFTQAFGADALGDVMVAFDRVAGALQAFQLEDVSFHPYTSKYDLHAGNKLGGVFTPAEARGFSVFVDPKRGNCASCHYPGAGLGGSTGIFTDYSFEAIGVPRNAEIPANADPAYIDEGLCGPLRGDHTTVAGRRFCGLFKTPSLRNVATRTVFFHNGAVHTLEQAIRFYATRDTSPELWYPTVGGKVRKFDDLRPAYWRNVDTQMPLDGRAAATTPPLTEANIADLICFLDTLTDGYEAPSTPSTSGPCVH